LICVVSACTRVIYSSAGFCQRLLARLTRLSNLSPKPALHQLLLPYIAPTLFSFTFHRSLHCTTYMHQLLLPKLVKVTLGGIFVKEFCYTSGNHGSIWANFCSPSKTTKLVHISIGLPERTSKNVATERTSFLRER